VLTGSHQLALREAISQSLAGRTAILNLYPLTIDELTESNITFSTAEEYIYHGFLPRIHDQQQRPTQAYSNYYQKMQKNFEKAGKQIALLLAAKKTQLKLR
jgi:predicted AAA+ superfamily ATPase